MNPGKTIISRIRDKLGFYGKPFVGKNDLSRIVGPEGAGYGVRNLVQSGVISVVRPGELYFNELSRTPKDPYVIGARYAAGASPVFGGMSTYNRRGLTTQVANGYRVYNLAHSGRKTVLGVEFEFVKTTRPFLYGLERSMVKGERVALFDRERALLEYVREFRALPADFDRSAVDAPKLRAYAARYPIAAVARKIFSHFPDANP